MNRLCRAAAGALAVALTACSGPQAPLTVDVGSVPTDILLGAKVKAVATAPLPPILFTPVAEGGAVRSLLPIEVEPPAPGATTTTTAPPPPCPDLDPLAAPVDPATGDVAGAPTAATYTYRTAGSFEIGGATAQRGVLPPTSVRTIKNVAWSPTGTFFEFDVDANVAGQITTTHYRIVPAKGNQQNPNTTPTTQLNDPYPQVPTVGGGAHANPGIYLVSIREPQSAGRPAPTPTTFNGGAGMLLVRLPISAHDRFESTATAGDITERYTSTVGEEVEGQYQPKARVNACGTPLDAWTVTLAGEITQGNTAEGPRLVFATTYQFATQFGGISVEERVRIDNAEENGTPVHRELDATINAMPKKVA